MNGKLSGLQILTIGFMLFGIFFGAGNFIFPPFLGYQAGTNIIPALIGFLLGAVGLPLIGVIATAMFGGNALKIMNRVHPLFCGVFTGLLFLIIGPFFAVPRTATVAFSMTVGAFNPDYTWVIMALFMLGYFLLTFYFCQSSERLVDAIGKFMTPALVAIVLFIVAKALANPVGTARIPTEAFQANALTEGLLNGFQTMDAMGSFITAGIVVGAVKKFGATSKKEITKYTIMCGLIAAFFLSIIYGGLSFVGNTSGTFMEAQEGASILTAVVQSVFGQIGLVGLGVAIMLACLSTAIALTGSCANFFHEAMPSISYKKWLILFSAISFFISNLGLATLLQITVPMLQIMYPLIIILIVFVFADKLIANKRLVYISGVGVALFISLVTEFHNLGLTGNVFSFVEFLPMYNVGFGWVVPWLLTTIMAYFIPVELEIPSVLEAEKMA